MAMIQFRGEFAIWSYTVGHGRLMLRRPKTLEHPTRVDILLKDVGWMCLPTSFADIQIQEMGLEGAPRVLAEAGALRTMGRKLFVLSGTGCRGYVLAGTVAFHEDDAEYNDPSALLE